MYVINVVDFYLDLKYKINEIILVEDNFFLNMCMLCVCRYMYISVCSFLKFKSMYWEMGII